MGHPVHLSLLFSLGPVEVLRFELPSEHPPDDRVPAEEEARGQRSAETGPAQAQLHFRPGHEETKRTYEKKRKLCSSFHFFFVLFLLLQGYRLYEHRHSNKLIEEFMLLANISVATKIYNTFPDLAVLRSHPPPKEFLMDQTVDMLQNFGKYIPRLWKKLLAQGQI